MWILQSRKIKNAPLSPALVFVRGGPGLASPTLAHPARASALVEFLRKGGKGLPSVNNNTDAGDAATQSACGWMDGGGGGGGSGMFARERAVACTFD